MFRRVHAILVFYFCARIVASEADVPPELLARQATLVVRGVVNSKTVRRDPARRIVTEVEVQISEAWKGKLSAKTLTLIHPGGILGEEMLVTTAEPNYRIDEEVILFLLPTEDGKFITVSAGHGKFRVNTPTGERASSLTGTPVLISELKSVVAKNQ